MHLWGVENEKSAEDGILVNTSILYSEREQGEDKGRLMIRKYLE